MKSSCKLFIVICIFILFQSCSKTTTNGGKIPVLPKIEEWDKQNTALLILNEEIRANSTPENFYKRSRIYFNLNKNKEALDDINEAIGQQENDPRYHFQKAEILRVLNEIDKSFEEAKLAESLGLKIPELSMLLGDLYQRNKNYTEAKKYLNKSLKIAPFNGEIYYYLGILQSKLGDTLLAINHFELSQQYKPQFAETYKRLAEIFINQGQIDIATNYTKKLLSLYPNDSENWLLTGKTYLKSKNADSAYFCHKKASLLMPKNFQLSFDTGVIGLRLRYYSEALQHFENSYKYAPKTPFINTYFGICHENLGNRAKAEEYYTISFALNNRDFKAIEGLKRLQMGYYQQPYNPVFTSPEIEKRDTVVRYKINSIERKQNVSIKRDTTRKLQISNKFQTPVIK